MSEKTIHPLSSIPIDQPSPEAILGFNTAMERFWQPVLRSADLKENILVSVRLLGRPIVLARLDGELISLLDVCRHFQAQLSLGEVTTVDGKQAIQCPYHGWAYGPDGACVRIPQLAKDRKVPATISVPQFRVQEAFGLIWICLSGEPIFDLPNFAEFSNPEFRLTTLDEKELTHTSAPRMIMATLDDTHFPWVHEGILGSRDKPEAPNHTAVREQCRLKINYSIQQPGNVATGISDHDQLKAESERDQQLVDIHYENTVHMPNVLTLRKTTPAGQYIIWLATSPVDHCHTRNFWSFARDYDTDPSSDKRYESFSAHVRMQDKPIVESQRPWMLPPLWTQIELPQGGIDLPLIEYQRWLQELEIVIGI